MFWGITNLKKWFESNITFVFLTVSGLLLISFGFLFPKIMPFINKPDPVFHAAKITVDLSGAVNKPGLYELAEGTNTQNLLEQAGGVSQDADSSWVAKNLNLAQKLEDETKIYIPKKGEEMPTVASLGNSSSKVLGVTKSVSINTGTIAELDQLPGVGPVTAQKIIANRPYQNIDELLTKKAVPKSTFAKIKEMIQVD